jgi:hypothetical protein
MTDTQADTPSDRRCFDIALHGLTIAASAIDSSLRSKRAGERILIHLAERLGKVERRLARMRRDKRRRDLREQWRRRFAFLTRTPGRIANATWESEMRRARRNILAVIAERDEFGIACYRYAREALVDAREARMSPSRRPLP